MKLIDMTLKIIEGLKKVIAILMIALILTPCIFWGLLHLVEWTLRNSDADRPPHTPFYNYDDQVSYYNKYEKELNIAL